ncbi:MAG: hypothetical protein F6K35_06370 [Okeania sp. SIO2H7]|nr:hypothetical protein [Okeania sp. SIO2H7]
MFCIEQALEMPMEEQKQKMTKMYETVWKYDVRCWAYHMFELFQNTTHDVVSE